MHGSTAKQAKLPLYAPTCLSASGIFMPYIHGNEAKLITMPCTTNSINTVDCRHGGINKFIDDVGGLGFDGIALKNTLQNPLPPFVPVIPKAFFDISPEIIPYGIIGITLKDVFNNPPQKRAGRLCAPKELTIDENIFSKRLLKEKHVLLFSSGKDSLIELLWPQCDAINFFGKMGSLINTATGFDFSLFCGECPVGHALNLKKSLVTIADYEQYGIKSIPHIYWANEYHLQRWATFLNNNQDVKTVATNCQCYKTQDHDMVCGGIQWLLAHCKRLHFLLEGPSKKLLRKLESIPETAGHISIAVSYPACLARNHQTLNREKSQLEIHQLLTNNFHAYESLLVKTLAKM